MKWYSRPSTSPGRGVRVVYDTDSLICGSAVSSSLTRLVLPAPDGAQTMNKFPVMDVKGEG